MYRVKFIDATKTSGYSDQVNPESVTTDSIGKPDVECTTTGSPTVPSLAVVCDKPNQPSDESLYPVQDTGLLRQDGAPKLRFVNLNWYKQCAWLHWDTQSQKMFCFHCLRARQRAMFMSHRKL